MVPGQQLLRCLEDGKVWDCLPWDHPMDLLKHRAWSAKQMEGGAQVCAITGENLNIENSLCSVIGKRIREILDHWQNTLHIVP